MKDKFLQLLRVPPEPSPPDGTPESIRVFRAGKNYFRWRLAVWALAQCGVAAGLVCSLAVLWSMEPRLTPAIRLGWLIAEWGVVVVAFATAAISYFLQRLNYELRWYIITDRSLRIRSGVWHVEEITMTYANIQSIQIRRDPLQLVLGIADLEVKSAGGGASSPHAKSSSHTARFSGVDGAESLRDLITERLRIYRDAGLGDSDTHAPADTVAAAAELLAEAKKLRAALA